MKNDNYVKKEVEMVLKKVEKHCGIDKFIDTDSLRNLGYVVSDYVSNLFNNCSKDMQNYLLCMIYDFFNNKIKEYELCDRFEAANNFNILKKIIFDEEDVR